MEEQNTPETTETEADEVEGHVSSERPNADAVAEEPDFEGHSMAERPQDLRPNDL